MLLALSATTKAVLLPLLLPSQNVAANLMAASYHFLIVRYYTANTVCVYACICEWMCWCKRVLLLLLLYEYYDNRFSNRALDTYSPPNEVCSKCIANFIFI